jgi:hypothetical protein
MTDVALEAGLKVPSNLVLSVIGHLRAAASIHPIIAQRQELPRESFAYPFRMVRLEAARPPCDCSAPTSGASVG